MDWTLLIPASKSEPTLIAAVPIPATAVAAPARIVVVALIAPLAIPDNLLSPLWKPELSMLVSNFSVPS